MNNIFKKSKKNIFWLHLFVWLILFSLPIILSSGQQQILDRVIVHSWIPLLIYAIIFYLNYLVLIEKFFFSKKIIAFAIFNILLITLFVWLRGVLNHNFFMDLMPNRVKNEGPPFSLFIYIQIISFLIPITFSIALKFGERFIKNEAEKKEAEKNKLEYELQYLKYQLQPHFFFNSLNNIYSLVDISPNKAKSTIHSLGKLMRYLLYKTNTQKIALLKEIQFMQMYLELMELRLTEKTTIKYTFPNTSENIYVAPLLFIPLVENAFKHGVSTNLNSTILFNMKLQDNTIIFSTKNANFPKSVTDKSGSGIGLQNLKKRLQLIYPNKHSFEYYIQNNEFITKLTITIN